MAACSKLVVPRGAEVAELHRQDLIGPVATLFKEGQDRVPDLPRGARDR